MDIKKSKIMWVALALVILLVAALAVSLFQVTSLKMKVDSTIAENEQLQLTNDQLQLANEYEAINSQFARYEDQAMQMGATHIILDFFISMNHLLI